MALVKFEEGTLNIDAAVIGRGLNIETFPSSRSDARRKDHGSQRAGSRRGCGSLSADFLLREPALPPHRRRRRECRPTFDGRFWRPATSRFDAQTLSMTLLAATVKGRPSGVQQVTSRTKELDNDYLYGWSETPSAYQGGHD